MAAQKGRVAVRVRLRKAAVFVEIENPRRGEGEIPGARSLDELGVQAKRCLAGGKGEDRSRLTMQVAGDDVRRRAPKRALAVASYYSHRAARATYSR